MPSIDSNARAAARAGRILLRREPTQAELQNWSAIMAGADGLKALVRLLIGLPENAALPVATATARACDAMFGRYDATPPRDLDHWLTCLNLGDQKLVDATNPDNDLVSMFADIAASDYRADPCAAPIDLDGFLFAVRDSVGSPMVFVTGENLHLYLFKCGPNGNWKQTDLSAALPAPAHAHVQAVDVRQVPGGDIEIALAVGPRLGPTGGAATSTVYVATGLSAGLDDAGWRDAFRKFEKRTGGPADAIVSGIRLAHTSPDASSLVLVGASIHTVSNTWYFEADAPVSTGWTPLRIPEDADKVLSYSIGRYAGHAGVWTMYRVAPDVALTFTTFAPDQFGKNINVSYTEIPAQATSFLVTPGKTLLPDIYVAGDGISVYRGALANPERVTETPGATVLWAAQNDTADHVAYVDAKAALQIVSKPAGGQWSAPYSLTSSVEVAALLGDPASGKLQAVAITPGMALELRTIAAPGVAATSIEIPTSAVWPEDPLTPEELRRAIGNAAPVVHFDSGEEYMPSTVEFYLRKVGLWNQIKREWQISNGSLWDEAAKDMNRAALDIFPRSAADSETHDCDYVMRIPDYSNGNLNRADVPNVSDPAYTSFLAGQPQNASFSLHAKFAPSQNATDLVFWAFFPYNGGGKFKVVAADITSYVDLTPMGVHEGDWEHVLLRVDNNTLQAAKIYMSAHNGGDWMDVAELGKDSATGRHVVYMSRHGHASYATPGDNLSEEHGPGVLWQIGLVNHCDAGPAINLSDQGRVNLVSAGFLGAAAPIEPAWLQLPWRWGRYFAFTPEQLKEISGRILGALGKLPDMDAAQDAVTDILIRKKVLGDEGNSKGPQALKFKSNWFGNE
jgi:hypothetical protein